MDAVKQRSRCRTLIAVATLGASHSTIRQDGIMATARSDEMSKALDGPAPDIGAIEAFVAVHYGRLLGLAGLVCGDATQAEDIVQTALERTWRSRTAIRDDERVRPWLETTTPRQSPSSCNP